MIVNKVREKGATPGNQRREKGHLGEPRKREGQRRRTGVRQFQKKNYC